jgi:hypothetical protein
MEGNLIPVSYKYIDNLKISFKDGKVYNEDNIFYVKSPIINFEIQNKKLIIKVNKNSEKHDTFVNILEHIERLIDNNTIFIENDKITMYITPISKLFDFNTREIEIGNMIGNKCVVSFIIDEYTLKVVQLLMVK